MKVYLHIGTHKTGTTTIQHFCHHQREALLPEGIYYPEERLHPRTIQHSYLAELIEAGKMDEAGAFCRRIFESAAANKAKAVLLSGERLSFLTRGQIDALAGLFAGHEVEIILYLRNLESYAISLLGQNMKRGGRAQNIPALVERIRGRLDYTGLIAAWEAVFGGEHVIVKAFDAERGRLLPSFIEAIGLGAHTDRLTAKEGQAIMNPSPDVGTLMLMTLAGYNETMDDYVAIRAAYLEAFDGFDASLPLLPHIGAALCTGAGSDLSHPKLAPWREILAAPLKKAAQPFDAADYFERMADLLKALARRARGEDEGKSARKTADAVSPRRPDRPRRRDGAPRRPS